MSENGLFEIFNAVNISKEVDVAFRHYRSQPNAGCGLTEMMNQEAQLLNIPVSSPVIYLICLAKESVLTQTKMCNKVGPPNVNTNIPAL